MVNIVKPSLKFRYSLDPMPKNVTRLVQHHMAHPSWDIYDVHNFHKNSNGWNGIGYNYWIGFDGTIYEGRGLRYGAGVGGHNHYTLHIGYQGDFTSQKMTDSQVRAGAELNKWLMNKLGLAASAIVGHGDLAPSACPGRNFRMKDLKSAVKGASGNVGSGSGSKWTKVTGDWIGQTLGEWEYGEPVRQLQELLYNTYPRYLGKSDIDSYYGKDTASAVKKFQGDHGLAVDGLAGKSTYKKLKGALTVSEYNKIDKRLKKIEDQLKGKLNKPVQGKVSSVHEENWNWGHDEGITKQSNPYAYVNYEQVISLLKNLHDNIKPTYQSPGSSHDKSWNKMVELGLITDINPHHPVKRAQLATILDNAGVLQEDNDVDNQCEEE